MASVNFDQLIASVGRDFGAEPGHVEEPAEVFMELQGTGGFRDEFSIQAQGLGGRQVVCHVWEGGTPLLLMPVTMTLNAVPEIPCKAVCCGWKTRVLSPELFWLAESTVTGMTVPAGPVTVMAGAADGKTAPG